MLTPLFLVALGAGRIQMPKPGAPVPAAADTPLVTEARAFIQKHLAILRILEVREATTQVVNGRNVKLTCTVQDEDGTSLWEFAASRRRDGHWRLMSARRLSDETK
jgi:hypothetical protein